MQCSCPILISVASSALQYFSTINETIFERKKKKEHKMCFDFSIQLLSETLLVPRTKKYTGLHIK
jgi:hypothetical protein